ncbi:MAG TPA: T9SS type A sorting domain-containing protein, partial [Bacteroidia bacterium]|nr:T9SS type A sorting domain-containing protein [Bacteroidia bacterium]
VINRLGNMFITEYNNDVIREVQNGTGTITTIAGNHTPGYTGDGGPANVAELANPWGITVDVANNLFLADEFNNVIREINYSTGNISTIAGDFADGFGYSGDGGPATIAELYAPVGVKIDNSGNLFIADNQNNVIREVNSVTIGINEIKPVDNDEVNIYPNPNNGNFTIALSHAELVSASQTNMEVYNVFGEKVYATFLTQTPKEALSEVNLSALPNGVYFIRIVNREANITKQVVIEK